MTSQCFSIKRSVSYVLKIVTIIICTVTHPLLPVICDSVVNLSTRGFHWKTGSVGNPTTITFEIQPNDTFIIDLDFLLFIYDHFQ